jgi:hypothetical protein
MDTTAWFHITVLKSKVVAQFGSLGILGRIIIRLACISSSATFDQGNNHFTLIELVHQYA